MTESTTFFWITLFGISAMIVNSIGIWIIHKNREWAQNNKEYFMCFAAGMLITSPLIMAFPEAIAKNSQAGLTALAGFAFMFFSNRFIQYKTKQDELAFGITAIQGIGMHSFIDGIIYSVTFSVSIQIGILAGIGLVIHEFAEGVITYSFLIKSGINQKKLFYMPSWLLP